MKINNVSPLLNLTFWTTVLIGAGWLLARQVPGIAGYLEPIENIFITFWNLELTKVDDNPITTGKLLMGLLLLALGFWGARFFSGLLGNHLKNHTQPMVADIIKTAAFYLMMFVFTMISLELISIPLTVFTLLGGAVAIGVGFGSQNLMNNFISGLILMAEQPIRLGDLIQVGDLYGNIIRIGGRSTRVRTGDNVDIIVPNSAFLEQNVINWTLTDTKVRTRVTVGVAYGSPTAVVRDTLMDAVLSSKKVITEPKPLVLFQDFGDSALIFDVLFWIEMKTQLDRLTIESDIRFTIDHLCREREITIAFPQQDVHLDSTKPLDVRVLH